MRRHFPLAALGLLAVCHINAADAPTTRPSLPSDGFISLFNGKDLDGWVVTTCEAKVEDGNLVTTAGNGMIRSEKQYGDFILELEWKNRQEQKYDSGVLFRAIPKKFKRWPEQWQINLLAGEEGSLVGHAKGKVTGLSKAGQWNQVRLKVVGKTAELTLNEKAAWKVDDIEPASGYVGIQVEVPNGGSFEFRNIRIKALEAK